MKRLNVGWVARAAWPVAVAAASVPGLVAAAAENHVDREVAALKAEVRGKGWIAYGARSEHGDWDLYLCRPDGSDIRPLSRTPAFSEFAPQFSRDGTKLLYRRVGAREKLDGNRYGEQGELVLANADGSSPVVLGKPGELAWASFSPDGTQLASLSIKGILFFDLERRTVIRTLPRKGFFQQVTWSPDGQWLCGVANSFGASWSVARMHAQTGEANAVNVVDCCTPDWFPDSRQVLFSWRPPGQKANQGHGWTQLWRAAADGSWRQLVYAEEGRHVYGGHVSPDGQYVLFSGNMEEDGDPGRAGAPMALMRLRDGPIIGGESPEFRAKHPEAGTGPVLPLPVGWEPCWTFAELVGSEVAEAPAEKQKDQHPSSQNARLAAEVRSQGWLVYSARTEVGDWDLFLARPDGSDRRRLTNTPQFNEAGARFSPNGRRLLYYRMPKAEPVDNNNYGTFDLVIANSDGSEPRVLGNRFQWASWGPDNRQIACLSPKRIQIVELETGQIVRELPRFGVVSQLVWSPDGKHFAGTANGLGPYWNIACMSLDTERIVAVSEPERYNCTPDWAPDSQRIVYARGIVPEQGGRAELWVAHADGRQRRRLYAESDRHIYGACVSPCGRYLLFTRSAEDLGKAGEVEMAIIRWADAAKAGGQGASIPRLDIGPGWEPHWTASNVVQ